MEPDDFDSWPEEEKQKYYDDIDAEIRRRIVVDVEAEIKRRREMKPEQLMLIDVIRGIDQRVAFIIKELKGLSEDERYATLRQLHETLHDCVNGVWSMYRKEAEKLLLKSFPHDDMVMSQHDRKEVNE